MIVKVLEDNMKLGEIRVEDKLEGIVERVEVEGNSLRCKSNSDRGFLRN